MNRKNASIDMTSVKSTIVCASSAASCSASNPTGVVLAASVKLGTAVAASVDVGASVCSHGSAASVVANVDVITQVCVTSRSLQKLWRPLMTFAMLVILGA